MLRRNVLPSASSSHRVKAVNILRRTARPVARRSGPDPGPPPHEEQLPPELKDLQINEDGLLIDSKTGKVINEMGATRFDVAVRALRGELDPPEWVENSERTPGVILSALYQFPRSYIFQVVGRPAQRLQPTQQGQESDGAVAGTCSTASFVSDITTLIARVTQAEVQEDKVEVKKRLGGKYVSISVDVMVRAPELISMVYEELAKDPRVVMKF